MSNDSAGSRSDPETDSRTTTDSYAGAALLAYLREAALSQRIHPATARSRRKAAEALFPYCRPEELSDLRSLNLQDLRARVADSPQGSLRPEVADLYLERLRSALRDYLADGVVPNDPIDGVASVRKSADAAVTVSVERPTPAAVSALEAARLRLDQHRADIIPVPLTADRVVFLQGIPADLTAAEARKIARVVEALAVAADENP